MSADDITNGTHAVQEDDAGADDRESTAGVSDNEAPAPHGATTFAERLQEYAAMNGDAINAIIADAPSLAALPRADRLRLFAWLREQPNIGEVMLQELRTVIDKEQKRKTNRADAGFRISERIRADLTRWNYHLWLNDMDDSVWNHDEQLTDVQRAELRMRARDDGYAEKKLLSALDDAILAIAASERRHPLRDYLAGLTWDGNDHIAALAGYFEDAHTAIDYGDGTSKRIFHAFLHRWLVGSIARINGDRNAARDNRVLVLAAEQGKGKSHFAGWICPKPAFFVERHVNPDDKDTSLLRARCWVWEIGELGATTKRADVEALKNHITATTVTERKAYGHFDTVKPAIASYVGTVNPDGAGFLVDSTGNRRFAVVEIKSINWAYATEVDVNQVWAQAMAAWQEDPNSYRLHEVERSRQEENAETHIEPDAFGDMLAHTFDFGGTDRMTSTDMLRYLHRHAGLSHGPERQQGRELSRALFRHWGIGSKRSNGATWYVGVKLKEQWQDAEEEEEAEEVIKKQRRYSNGKSVH